MKRILIIVYYLIIFALFLIHCPKLRNELHELKNYPLHQKVYSYLTNNKIIDALYQIKYKEYYEIFSNQSLIAFQITKNYTFSMLNITGVVFTNMSKKFMKSEYIMPVESTKINENLKSRYNSSFKSECKHNFASLSSGASLIEYPRDSDGASGILSSSKDKYLIIPSSVEQNFLISLSEDAIINQFMIMNSEEFSCTVNDFVLYGADTFVSHNQSWEKLGTFKAHKSLN